MHVQPETVAEQLLGDQHAVGGDDDHARVAGELGRAAPAARREMPRRCGDLLGRRRAALAAAAPAGCPAGCTRSSISRRAASPSSIGRAERRGRRDGDASCRERGRGHASGPRTAAGGAARAPPRRSSGVVRSMMRTPSRWSSSCWITRASSPSASTVTGSPAGVVRLDASRDAAARRGRRPRRAERQTAFVDALALLGRGRRPRVDERDDRHPRPRSGRRARAEDPDLRRRKADAAGLLHQRGHPLDERGERVVERPRPRCARMRSTGSGYWRICASAARRRASRSASSSLAPDLAFDLAHEEKVYRLYPLLTTQSRSRSGIAGLARRIRSDRSRRPPGTEDRAVDEEEHDRADDRAEPRAHVEELVDRVAEPERSR